ncbi:MAG: DUF4855 domain-containing protein [Clostridia bacterium]|nr:DUF4855 domain-containing protein [Clostridia bacterium]
MKIQRLISLLIALLLISVPLFSISSSAKDEVISVGKSYTVEYETEIKNAYPKKEYQQENNLTDGKIDQTAKYSNAAWTEFYRGTAVKVTIDLEEVMSVSRVVLTELQYKSAGIYCSRYAEVHVSEDGENFGFAGRLDDPEKILLNDVRRVGFDVTFDKSYKARYVKVIFSSDVFTYVDEISVYGNGDASGAATAEPIEEKADLGFAKPIDGISNISLMYTASQYSSEQLKYYFAYHDSTGAPKDLMFDSMLFLALTKTAEKDGFMRQADMKAFVSEALTPNRNIGALNHTVGDLKDDLGFESDYKYPIFVSMPYIGVYNSTFGEINGKSVSSSNLEERKAIAEWYIDYLSAEFEKCGYENLELKGIYWFEESIRYTLSTHEEELMKHFNEYAHSKGFKTIWIPYFSSSGIDKVPELGFDAVTMQSGYAFNGGEEVGTALPESVKDCADAAKQYGMGMEFEVDMNVDKYFERFSQYVHVAYAEGLMDNGIMMMYQVGDNIYRSAIGNARELYELTYKYNSKTYTEHAPVIKDGATLTLKVGGYANTKLDITDEDTAKMKLKIANIEKPEGVFFAAEGNGFIEAQAADSVPGTYVACLSVTDGYNESNTVEITIIVEPADDASASESSTDANSSPDSSEDNGITVYIVIGIAALVVIIVVAVIIIILRSKKINK